MSGSIYTVHKMAVFQMPKRALSGVYRLSRSWIFNDEPKTAENKVESSTQVLLPSKIAALRAYTSQVPFGMNDTIDPD